MNTDPWTGVRGHGRRRIATALRTNLLHMTNPRTTLATPLNSFWKNRPIRYLLWIIAALAVLGIVYYLLEGGGFIELNESTGTTTDH